MSGSLNSGWLSSLFSSVMNEEGVWAPLSTSIVKAEITDVMPQVSSAARSVELISSGVTWSSVIPVKPELKRDESR